jgi:hypothetical protein
MNETLEQIVQRLRTISATDRDWLLHRLSADERRLVLTALVGNGKDVVNGQNGMSSSIHTNGHSTDAVARNQAGTALAALTNLPVEDVATLLAGESDWTIVVLMQAMHWPWAEDYLRSLPTAKLHDLRELSDQLGDSVRPKVKEAVARIMADRVQQRAPRNVNRTMFDLVLERVQRNPDIQQEPRITG